MRPSSMPLDVTRGVRELQGRFTHTMLFPCHSPAMPFCQGFRLCQFDLHSAVVFDSHIPCRSHAVPLPWHEYAIMKATSQGHGRVVAGSRQGDGMVTAWERHGMCELASAVHRRHVGDLPAFGLFLLPRGVQEVYQKYTNLRCRWTVWNKATFVMDEKKLIILVQGHDWLYNFHTKIIITI
jgi:hypothetical protein